MAKTSFRLVLDTNVIISAHFGTQNSPCVEISSHWKEDCFTCLYSIDILDEYVRKMFALGVEREQIREFLTTIKALSEKVPIVFYHHRKYPTDPDDIAFILCADNGNATDIVSYDSHLLDLHGQFVFDISKPLVFLRKLRATV